MEKGIEKELKEIWELLANAGYDPFTQLFAYLKTGNPAYITRQGNARNRVGQISLTDVRQYLLLHYQ